MNNQISVIIPIYNIAPYLDRSITSVINQTYRNLQIILVDDGSSDGSSEICDRYAAQDDRIQVVHKPNGGLVSARKAGLREATGEYVAYVDGDDWIEPDMYEKLLDRMLETDADMVESDAYMDMGEEAIPMRSGIPYGTYNADMVIPQMLCDEAFNICSLKAYIWSKLFKRSILEAVQYEIDDTICFGEDVAVTYSYILRCKKIAIMDYAGYHYDQRQGSLVYTVDESEWQKNVALIRYLYDCFNKSSMRSVLLPQLNQYAKLLLLLRQIAYFDRDATDCVLTPYGGIPEGEQVIIYGAGRIGQSVYNYLSGMGAVSVVCWADREYEKYRQMGWNVQAPDAVFTEEYKNAKIVIAMYTVKTAASIRNWLIKNGIREDKIMCLTEEFIKSDSLYSMLGGVL